MKRTKGTRRPLDAYYTPAWMTRALLAHVPEIDGRVLECCAGDGSIAQVLEGEGGLLVLMNDVDGSKAAHRFYDAQDPGMYLYDQFDWVITNPPYAMPLCTNIVANAIKHARVGVAMMLRLSFKEPTAHINPRGPFLVDHPLTRELVMPRYSFTGNGKSDSVTTAWMIWSKMELSGAPMLSLYNADVMYAEPF